MFPHFYVKLLFSPSLTKGALSSSQCQSFHVMPNRIHLVLMYIVSMKSLLMQRSSMYADVTFMAAGFWNSMRPMIDIICIAAFSPKPNLARHYLFLLNITIWHGHRNCNWRTQDTLIQFCSLTNVLSPLQCYQLNSVQKTFINIKCCTNKCSFFKLHSSNLWMTPSAFMAMIPSSRSKA